MPETGVNACFYKAPAWKYEEEWRCVREFAPSESRLIMFEPAIVKEIVFGHQMEGWHIAQIMRWVTGYEMRGVEFFVSSPDQKSWELKNKRKAVSLCISCGGDGYLMEDPV